MLARGWGDDAPQLAVRRYTTTVSHLVRPWRWHQRGQLLVLLDCDRALVGRADRACVAAGVDLRGKHGYRADFHAADVSSDLGRDADVRIVEELDVAYGHVHQPVLDRNLGSRRSGEA